MATVPGIRSLTKLVNIQNKQRAIPIFTKHLKIVLAHLLIEAKCPDYEVGCMLISSRRIHHHNKMLRGVDRPTDTLSFPVDDYTNIKPGTPPPSLDGGTTKDLGSIFLCPEYVMYHHASTFDQRLALVLAHSVCHLLGYTHDEDKDFRIMRAKEESLLKGIKTKHNLPPEVFRFFDSSKDYSLDPKLFKLFPDKEKPKEG